MRSAVLVCFAIISGLHERCRLLVAVGSLGGLDADIVLTEVTFADGAAAQFLGGHAYVNPTARGVPAMSVWRAGSVWAPMRGRVTIDNRLLIERR
jgi:hypothetical protein